MDKSNIPLLAEGLELYYTYDELMEMAEIFDVKFENSLVWKSQNFNWLRGRVAHPFARCWRRME